MGFELKEKKKLEKNLHCWHSMWISGKVNILEETNLSSFHRHINQPVAHNGDNTEMKLTAKEIYKELRLRGYDYGKTFQGILESNNAGKVEL